MSENEKCPKCGAEMERHPFKYQRTYKCGSVVVAALASEGSWKMATQSDACRIDEQSASLTAVQQETEALRAAFIMGHNGDMQIKWNPEGFWAYGRDRDQSLVRLAGPCDAAVEAALAALAQQGGK